MSRYFYSAIFSFCIFLFHLSVGTSFDPAERLYFLSCRKSIIFHILFVLWFLHLTGLSETHRHAWKLSHAGCCFWLIISICIHIYMYMYRLIITKKHHILKVSTYAFFRNFPIIHIWNFWYYIYSSKALNVYVYTRLLMLQL